MTVGIYTGSFDPVTLGHLNQIERAAKLCDKLIVALIVNVNKTSLFSVEERVSMLKRELGGLKNVEIRSFSGFAVDFAKEAGANVIFRGLRNAADYAYEATMAQYNYDLNPAVETVFLPASLETSYVSSSGVKEIASLGGDVSKYVSKAVAEDIMNKLK